MMMMNIPKEIDLYDWYDYSFLRAVLKLPIPSPRVWNNAGTFGFTGGKYLKDIFFEPDFFEPSLYTKEKLTSYIKEKYGNNLRLEKGKGKLMKSDKSNHKFASTSDNNHLYLNFKNFKEIKQLENNIEYEKIYEAIGEIYSLATINNSAIDIGYYAPGDNYDYYTRADKNEQKWINLNRNLEKGFNSDEEPIELLYENVYKFFDYPSKKLWDLNEILNNDFWFVEMFLYSFKPKTSRWLKGNSLKKDFEKPFISKYLDELKEKVSVQKNDSKENKNNQINTNKPISEQINTNKPISEQTNTLDVSPKGEKVRENKKTTGNFSKKYPKKNKVIIPGIVLVGLVYLIIGNFSQNNSNNKPQIPTFNPPPRNDPPPRKDPLQSLDQICRMCRITGDCSAFSFCTKSQRTCEWKQNWDGKWIQDCRSF